MYVRVTSKGQITIPHEVRNQLNLATGALVSVVVKNDRAELIPVEDDVMALRGSVQVNDPQDFEAIEAVYNCDSSAVDVEKRIAEQIEKGDRNLIISPTATMDKLQNLKKRKHAIKGDPEDLVTITWDKELNFDLPYHRGTSGVERQYPLNKRPNHFNTL